MRALQVEINEAVLSEYVFEGINPEYGFHEVAYLPDGENLRYGFSEEARVEILTQLALLNKARHEEEKQGGTKNASRQSASKSKDNSQDQNDLFSES